MSLRDEHHRRLLEGTAYLDPNEGRPDPGRVFGTRLIRAAQSYEDQTVPYLYAQVQVLTRRLAQIEAELALLRAQGDL